MNNGNQRQRPGDDQGGDPVPVSEHPEHGEWDDHGQEQLGQVEREITVERVDSPGREDRELASALLAAALGPQRGDVLQQRRPQLALRAGRASISQHVTSPGDGGAGEHDAQQRLQRETKGSDTPTPAERAGDHIGQQPGLGDDQQRSDPAQDDQSHEEWPGRARVP